LLSSPSDMMNNIDLETQGMYVHVYVCKPGANPTYHRICMIAGSNVCTQKHCLFVPYSNVQLLKSLIIYKLLYT
jgi:hypothetical protein